MEFTEVCYLNEAAKLSFDCVDKLEGGSGNGVVINVHDNDCERAICLFYEYGLIHLTLFELHLHHQNLHQLLVPVMTTLL